MNKKVGIAICLVILIILDKLVEHNTNNPLIGLISAIIIGISGYTVYKINKKK